MQSRRNKGWIVVWWYSLAFFILLAASFFILLVLKNLSPETLKGSALDNSCVTERETRIVRGNSLEGIVSPGHTITILRNYYACHKPERGDIVAYYYAGSKDPLIKIVKAIGGDVWSMQKNESGAFTIIVNGSPLTTSTNDPYAIPQTKSAMLERYATIYPTIPDDALLLLGNIPTGSLDSTKFGLAHIKDVIGRVIF